MDNAEKRRRAQTKLAQARSRGDAAEVAKWEQYLAAVPAEPSAAPKPVAAKPVAPKPAAPKPVAPKPVPAPVAAKPVPAKPTAPRVVAPLPGTEPSVLDALTKGARDLYGSLANTRPEVAPQRRGEVARPNPDIVRIKSPALAEVEVVATAGETRDVLEQKFIQQGYSPADAADMAEAQVTKTAQSGMTPGRVQLPASGAFLPVAQESRNVPYADGYVYDENDPTKIRQAGALELVGEALKRQTVMTPEARAQYKERMAEQADGSEPLLPRNILTAPDPRTGRVIETPFGAGVRAATSWLPSVISTAVFDYSPFFYDADAEGKPVDPEQAAYKVRQFLDDYAQENPESKVTDLINFQKDTGRLSPQSLLVPAPFQATTRKVAKPSVVDPYAVRVAPSTGNFISDVALNVARGRSFGDDLVALPALGDSGSDGANFATGIVYEFLTPAGPGTAVRTARSFAKAAGSAADAVGATKVAKVAGAVAAPVEAARTALTRGEAAKVAGQSPELAAAVDRNSVLNVAASKVSSAVGAPADVANAVAKGLSPALTGATDIRATAALSPAAQRILDVADAGKAATDARATAAGNSAVAAFQARFPTRRSPGASPALQRHLDGIRAKAEAAARAPQKGDPSWQDAYVEWRHAMTAPDVERLIARLEKTVQDPAEFQRQLLKGAQTILQEATPTQGTSSIRVALDALDPKVGVSPVVVRSLLAMAADASKAEPNMAVSRVGRIALGIGDNALRSPDAFQKIGSVTPSLVAPITKQVADLVKSDLRNVIPQDLVFVSSSFIVPRSKVKEGLAALRDAAEEVVVVDTLPDGLLSIELPRGVLSPLYGDAWADLMQMYEKARARGVEAFRQGRLSGAPELLVTPQEYDTIISRIAKLSLRDSVEQVVGGKQIQKAMVAPERAGGFGDLVEEARDLVLAVTPKAVTDYLETRKSNVVRWISNTQEGQRVYNSPALDQAVRAIDEGAGSLTKRFRAELASALSAAKKSGSPNPGADAVNAVIGRRLATEAARRGEEIEREVVRLQKQGLTDVQAWFVASYQRTGDVDTSLGVERARYWSVPRADAPQTIAALRARAYKQSVIGPWEKVLEFFFGEANYERSIRPQLLALISDGTPDGVLNLTVENMARAVQAVRTSDPSLAKAGISEGISGLSSRDNLVGTLVGWALESDRADVVAKVTRQMLIDNPNLGLDLLPSFSLGRNVVAARSSVDPIRAATDATAKYLAQRMPSTTSVIGRLAQGVRDPDVVRELGSSKFMAEVVDRTERNVMNINVETAQTIAKKLIDGVFSRGSLTPSKEKTALLGISVPELEKQATFEGFKAARALMNQKGQTTTALDKEILVALTQAERDARATPGATAADIAKARAADDAFYRGLVETVQNSTLNSILPQMEGDILASLRAAGITTATNLSAGDADKALAVFNRVTKDTPIAILYGADFDKAVRAVSASSADGRLLENLEKMRRSPELSRTALGVLEAAAGFAQRTYSTGMLGGWVAPNMRYLGVNLVTAPLLMMTTLGKRFTDVLDESLLAGDVVSAVAPRVGSQMQGDLAFVSASGVPWTRAMLKQAEDRNNLGMTRGDVEFEDSIVQTILDDVRVLSDGAPESVVDAAVRILRPDTPTVWQRVANETDYAMRQMVFAGALKAGRPETQAAEMARASVLDYGATPGFVRAGVAKVVMFASFRLAMLTELLNGLAKDPSTFARVLRTQMLQQQAADTWLTGDDQNKARLPVWKTGLFDRVSPYAVVGPQNPVAQTALDLTNAAVFAAQLSQPDNQPIQRIAAELENQALTPGVDMLLTALTTPNTEGPSGKAPTEYLVAARFADSLLNSGRPDLYHWFLDYADLERVEDDKMRPGQETINGYQWRFGSTNGKRRFQLLQAALGQMAVKRLMEDGSKLIMSTAPPEGVDAKRRGESSGIGYLLGTETPIVAPGLGDMTLQSLEQAQRRLQQQQAGSQK